jgi:hypothetical protein
MTSEKKSIEAVVDHLNEHLLIEFSHTISEMTFVCLFFIFHPAGSKILPPCSLQRRPVHKFIGNDKFMPNNEK